MNIRVKEGFTLAEVLMTLAIIGVVAAMSIPSLISNTNNSGNVQKVKKFYSNLSDAYQLYMVDNGDITSGGAFNDNTSVWNNLIKPYFSIVKDCTSSNGCWLSGAGAYKFLNNVSYGNDIGADGGILVDGTLVRAWTLSSNCSSDRSTTDSGPLFSVCGGVNIDVNGEKAPNQFGRDIFGFYIAKTGVYPVGSLDDIYVGCDPNSSDASAGANGAPGQGVGCTAKVVMESAMDY